MKFPSLYYSNKTKTHWLLHEVKGDIGIISEQVMGGYKMEMPIETLQKAIQVGNMVYRESASILMQEFKLQAEKPTKKRK